VLDLLLIICISFVMHIMCHCNTRSSSRDETASVNFFYDDIMHALQNTKRAEVYTNFIMVKSDLHLNLKIMMSKLCSYVTAYE